MYFSAKISDLAVQHPICWTKALLIFLWLPLLNPYSFLHLIRLQIHDL